VFGCQLTQFSATSSIFLNNLKTVRALGKRYQQTTERKSGLGCGMKVILPPRGSLCSGQTDFPQLTQNCSDR
jgi:hypothetical protein